VDIHLTTIKHTEFHKCEKPCTKWQLVEMSYTSFLPKSTNVSFHQEGIYYRTAHKYSTEIVINTSRLTSNFDPCYI